MTQGFYCSENSRRYAARFPQGVSDGWCPPSVASEGRAADTDAQRSSRSPAEPSGSSDGPPNSGIADSSKCGPIGDGRENEASSPSLGSLPLELYAPPGSTFSFLRPCGWAEVQDLDPSYGKLWHWTLPSLYIYFRHSSGGGNFQAWQSPAGVCTSI